jgi:hypothetical protein
VEDGVRRELMQLHAIDEEKPTKEFVGMEREPAVDEGKKEYPKAIIRAQDDLVTGIITFVAFGSIPVLLILFRSLFVKSDLA